MAMQSLGRIEAALTVDEQDTITPLRITVRDLKASFESLVNEQKSLGFNENEGVTAGLIAASNGVENIIHDDLSWVADEDRAKMLISLLTMRRYEIEYRLTRDNAAERHFLDETKNFNSLFESVDGAPSMKQKLNEQVQNYRYNFAQWVASTDNIEPLVSLISHDTASVLPEADRIIETAQFSASSRRHRTGLFADAHAQLHHLGGIGGGADLARLQLAHRAFDHAAARGPGRRDETARRRRHVGEACPPRIRATRSAPWRARSWCFATT